MAVVGVQRKVLGSRPARSAKAMAASLARAAFTMSETWPPADTRHVPGQAASGTMTAIVTLPERRMKEVGMRP